MNGLTIGSFFSGIGAFEKALERLEIPHETVFYCEIDKYASKAYSLIHNVPESFNLWDITKVNEKELPDFDLMTWGFPCTDLSVAGKQKGFVDEDGNKTRSGLYADGLRILRHCQPKYSIIENVKALVSEKFRAEFHMMLCDLEDAGYKSYWQVLNAKDYGIPQNRERVFIVSIRKDVDDGFTFPLPFDNGLRLKDLLEDGVDEKYYISQEKTEQLLKSIGLPDDMFVRHTSDGCHLARKDAKQSSIQGTHVTYPDGNSHCMGSSHVPMTVIPILTPDFADKKQNGRRFKDDGEPMFTLTGQDRRHGVLQIGVLNKRNSQSDRVYSVDGTSPCLDCMQGGNKQPKVLQQYRIRKLTPLECFRLMGFDDRDYWRCKDAGISDSQLYKVCGNSIVVQVLEGILNNLFLQSGSQPDYFYAEQLSLFG